MKKNIPHTGTLISIALAIALIGVYQMFWLVNYYKELKQQMNDDIQEVLRSSDFEELANRVDEISKMNIKGRIDVNVGYDHENSNSVTRAKVKESDKPQNVEEHENNIGTHTVVTPQNFGDVLRSPEDIIGVGLNMQRGIHSALDMIMDVDVEYLDSIITQKLATIGIDGDHQLFYIKDKKIAGEPHANDFDTLAKKGLHNPSLTDSFSLKVSDSAEYQMIIKNYNMVIIKKMLPIILFSVGTLVLLVVTFLHLLRIMHKQKELEEIKTDFTNNITHELKTPIAVAYAANDALLNFDSAGNTPRMNRYLSICQEQLRLLDRLVEQILSLSVRRDKSLLLNIETIDVKELVSSLVNIFKLKYTDRISIVLEIEEGLTMTTDRMHLSNIISNLMDNAVKYSKDPAVITICSWKDADGKCIMEVKDKGIGISKEHQKFIFNRFYRVPHGNVHDVKGYGLGLFYVKSMIEKLGGNVEVKSTVGKGSTFRLIFHPVTN